MFVLFLKFVKRQAEASRMKAGELGKPVEIVARRDTFAILQSRYLCGLDAQLSRKLLPTTGVFLFDQEFKDLG